MINFSKGELYELDKIKKIDGHIHILPDIKVAEQIKYGAKDWSKASVDDYIPFMDEYNIEKAIVVPINEGGTYFRNPKETNKYLSTLMEKYLTDLFALLKY